MWIYLISAAVWIGILFGWLIPVIRKKIVHEIYAACGVGILFSLIILGNSIWKRGNILPLVYIGYAFHLPAAFFVISAFINLKQRGKPESGWENTTKLIKSSVYQIVRHPLYLGSALFIVAMILLSQSAPSIISGFVGMFCFWMAAKKEDKFNIKKFGDDYREYMEKISMWNFFNLSYLQRMRRGHRENDN